MKISVKYNLLYLLVFFSTSLWAQIENPGMPIMNSTDFKAEDIIYVLPLVDPIAIEAAKSLNTGNHAKPLQYAIERPVDLSPDYNGAWTERNGIKVWRAHIISSGAFSLGLFFSEYNLKGNAKVFVYDPEGNEIKGAFTKANNKEYASLYVGHIAGEELIVELQVPSETLDYGELRIGTLSHAFLPVYAKKNITSTGLGTAQECEIDVNCEIGDDWQILKRSVVYIETSTQLCSGILVNNVSYDGSAYIITAEHCINTEHYATSSAYYFNYENDSCGINNGKRNQSVSGSILKATGGDLDFSLLNLKIFPPKAYNAYYAGWDARDMQHAGTATIHHPNGDAKKISFDFDATQTASSTVGDLSDYITESNFKIAQWDIGSTEGGSSGCPLFNSSKRLIGTLSGGEAFCGNYIGDDPETGEPMYDLTVNINDFYSRISYNWDHYSASNKQLAYWLDPHNTGTLSIGGMDGKILSISESDFRKEAFILYPNPSNGIVNLSLNEYTGKSLLIRVLDISGSIHYSAVKEASYPIQLNLHSLSPGYYLVQINVSGKVLSSKLIIQ